MFANCEALGQEKNTGNTLPEGLFRNNLLLENTSYMFYYCINLSGIIPNIFYNSREVI